MTKDCYDVIMPTCIQQLGDHMFASKIRWTFLVFAVLAFSGACDLNDLLDPDEDCVAACEHRNECSDEFETVDCELECEFDNSTPKSTHLCVQGLSCEEIRDSESLASCFDKGGGKKDPGDKEPGDEEPGDKEPGDPSATCVQLCETMAMCDGEQGAPWDMEDFDYCVNWCGQIGDSEEVRCLIRAGSDCMEVYACFFE